MKSKLLVTTAALALTISASANAQMRSDAKPDQPAAIQSQKENGSAQKEMNRTENGSAQRPGTGTTGQSATDRKSSDTKAADDTRAGDRKPSSAQDTTASPRNGSRPDDKASNSSSSDTARDKSKAARDDKSPASDRKQATEPADSKSNTAGQTDPKRPAAAQGTGSSDRDQATTNSRTNERDRDTATDTRTESSVRVSASLKTEEKARLRQAVTRLDVKPVTNVNFAISVGTAVPRTVSLHPVPTTIVEIVPQYRGYDYFVVREQVIIVHPQTHKIVDVIERGGDSRASVSTTRERRVNLSDKQRAYLRQHTTSRQITTGSAPRGSTTVVIGQEVPQTVQIETFPEEVYREVPTVREYRYIRSGAGVYLVDPGTRQVIEEID